MITGRSNLERILNYMLGDKRLDINDVRSMILSKIL